LIGKVDVGFMRFDHDEHYEEGEDGERWLTHSYMCDRLTLMLASIPTNAPGSAEAYLGMLTEHVSAVEGLTEIAFESACRAIVEEQKFCPAVPEVLKQIRKQVAVWQERKWALRSVEGARRDLIKALQKHEQEKKQQEREQVTRAAKFKLQNAVWDTKRWAKEIETAKAAAKAATEAAAANLASLVQRHAAAEKRESELASELRKLTTPPEEAEAEAEAAAAEAFAKYNGSGAKLV
jgi:hypothetical protein